MGRNLAVSMWILSFVTILVVAQDVPTGKKVIKDKAEYNAYIAALHTQDPVQKAAAMEAFVTQYPNSVVKVDALEQAMQAYQQAGNQPKVQETAAKTLELNPNSLRALAIVTFIERANAKTPEKAVKVRVDGEKGLALLPGWQKPEGISDADFEKLRSQMTVIFAGAAGFGALQAKDYGAAKGFYQKSIQINPNNLQDVYQMGVASLETTPIDENGLWYIAKAYNLAQGNAAGQKSINDYGMSKYRKYHGSEEGWNSVIEQAKNSSALPADFAVSRADPQQLASLISSKDWTAITVEIRKSAVATTGGDVQAYAVIAGQHEILLCTYDCSTFQPGNYQAEIKKGEIRIRGTSMINGKENKTTFRISGNW